MAVSVMGRIQTKQKQAVRSISRIWRIPFGINSFNASPVLTI